MAVYFNGRLLVTPTVESQIYDGAMAPVYPGRGSNIPVVIGTSTGGAPKEVLFFDSPVTARKALVDGSLLKGVEWAFNPSAETGSPHRVAAVRVEAAVQSSLMLVDTDDNDVIEVKSADHGAHTNSIKITITDGTQTGKQVTVQNQDYYSSKDNLARTPLTVRYTGIEATATVDVTATTLSLTAGADPAVDLTLANYDNVRELCDGINAVAGFSAIALMPTNPVVNILDGQTDLDCKDTDAAVTANLQVVIDWLNSAARDLVVATRQAGALAVPANITGTYLTGGSNGAAPDTDDWQDAFDALQGADVQWLVPLTADEDVHAMADAHCVFMSGPGKMERRAFVGGGTISGSLSSAIATAQTDVLSLNSDRTAYVFPAPMDTAASGGLEAIPRYFLACKLAGGFSAMNPGHTMTNKVLSGIKGIDPIVANAYDTDTLITSGILGVKKDRRGFVVVKANSTWLSNDNYNRVEISTGFALDHVARVVREGLETFIGRKASPVTLYEAISRTDSILRDLARPEPVGLGVIVGDAENPAYRNITAEINGDILRVWFECSPAIPINFVLVGIYANIYTGTASSVVNAG